MEKSFFFENINILKGPKTEVIKDSLLIIDGKIEAFGKEAKEEASKKNIKNASKIAEELYNRFNEEDRSLKDKKHIKNLLDWY